MLSGAASARMDSAGRGDCRLRARRPDTSPSVLNRVQSDMLIFE
jgi:hypothetical protein